jgi:murein DD-endopeptidase MepM/ murein hydrolase activator NlpD
MASLTAIGGIAVAAGFSRHASAGAAPPIAAAASAASASASPTPTLSPSPAVTVHNAPAVAPLGARIAPDVLVTSRTPLSAAQVAAIEKAAGPTNHALLVDAARVHLGGGTTIALGVDPSTFRAWTPAGTAESNPLWESIARGDVAVAHAVGKALAVPLGGTTTVGARSPVTERVGAYATTGLPGVGVVIDAADDAPLHLVRSSALLLTVSGQDPVLTAALLTKALGTTVSVAAVRVPVTNGHLQWVAPAYGPITSPFGPRPDPNHPGQTEFHEGIDIGAPLGAPIYAAADGVVQYAGPAQGFGNEVILTHAGGVETVYGHMETILVTSGPVTAGQPIALVGAEGDATGPHLHFEVHVNDTPVDPAAWLEAHGVKIER